MPNARQLVEVWTPFGRTIGPCSSRMLYGVGIAQSYPASMCEELDRLCGSREAGRGGGRVKLMTSRHTRAAAEARAASLTRVLPSSVCGCVTSSPQTHAYGTTGRRDFVRRGENFLAGKHLVPAPVRAGRPGALHPLVPVRYLVLCQGLPGHSIWLPPSHTTPYLSRHLTGVQLSPAYGKAVAGLRCHTDGAMRQLATGPRCVAIPRTVANEMPCSALFWPEHWEIRNNRGGAHPKIPSELCATHYEGFHQVAVHANPCGAFFAVSCGAADTRVPPPTVASGDGNHFFVKGQT